MRHQLATLKSHPEGVPINMLVRAEGTPLASMPAPGPLEMVLAIATAHILNSGVARPPSRGMPAARRGSGAVVFFRGGEFNSCRRKTADYAESRP